MADDAARVGRHCARAARTADADRGVLALVPVSSEQSVGAARRPFSWTLVCEGENCICPFCVDKQTSPAVFTELAMMGLTSRFLAACPTARGLPSAGLLCKASLVLTFFALNVGSTHSPRGLH